MRVFIVKFIPKSNDPDIVVHKIPLPDFGEKDFYRTISSWNAFCTGKRKDANKEDFTSHQQGVCWSPTGLYYTHDGHEQEWLNRLRRQLESLNSRPMDSKHKEELLASIDETRFPTVEHASLYDFYDYIGFDRKARKYKHAKN